MCVLLEGSNNLGLEGVAKCNRRHFCSEMKIKKKYKNKNEIETYCDIHFKANSMGAKKKHFFIVGESG